MAPELDPLPQRLLRTIPFVALGIGFSVLVAWGLAGGFAAGSLGGAGRAESPGTFWFLLAGEALAACAFFGVAARILDPRWRMKKAAMAALVEIRDRWRRRNDRRGE